MPPRVVQVQEVPGVEDALRTGDPVACAHRIADILTAGADPKEVVRTAALVAARHFAPSMPPPHAMLALGASLDLAPHAGSPELPVVQACALAASEWRDRALAPAKHAVSGDELHLGQSFLVAVRAGNVPEADATFVGLLREGEERRLAGDALFEACTQDFAGEGHKLTFAVGSWRLARALGWLRGSVLMRPAVQLAASTPHDLADFSALLRDVGRSRLDLELAGRNVAEIDAVARNGFAIALGAGPDRVVTELITGLKRGRSPLGYADLVAATAAERLVGAQEALEPALLALAARFLVGFSRTPYRILTVLQAARAVAKVEPGEMRSPARIADPNAAQNELELAVEGDDPREAASLALGLVDALDGDAIASVLVREAVLEDAHRDGGHRLLYAAWATEFAQVAPRPAYASLAAFLARTPKFRTVTDGL